MVLKTWPYTVWLNFIFIMMWVKKIYIYIKKIKLQLYYQTGLSVTFWIIISQLFLCWLITIFCSFPILVNKTNNLVCQNYYDLNIHVNLFLILTVPKIDSLTFHLRKMRREMGLVTELPRHGPGVKEHMVGIENRLLVEPAPVNIKPKVRATVLLTRTACSASR